MFKKENKYVTETLLGKYLRLKCKKKFNKNEEKGKKEFHQGIGCYQGIKIRPRLIS